MGSQNKYVTLIIILQILPQLISSAALNYPCLIPELSDKYNYNANGIQLIAGLYARDGTRVSFKCKNNLMLYPATSTRTICKDGSWTNEFPQCIRTCAPRFSDFVDVECDLNSKKINCTALIPVPEGTIAKMKCKENFILSSPVPDIAHCKDGLWDNGLLPCVPEPKISRIIEITGCEIDGVEVPCSTGSDETSSATDCILPEQPNNGKYVLLGGATNTTGGTVPELTILKYDCINNYELYPSSNLILCQTGQWIPEIPQCLSTCLPRLSESVDTTCMLNGIKKDCSKRMIEGTQVIMRCKPFYVQAINSPYTASVCKDGTWDYGFINCVPECGKLAIRTNGASLLAGNDIAEESSFPWHVAIYRQRTPDGKIDYICGGSIINTRVILSAAHCFTSNINGSKFDKNEFYIGAGKFYSNYDDPRDIRAQKSKVKEIIIPSIYKGVLSNFAGDLALVVLQTPFEITRAVQPVCVDWLYEFEDTQLRPNNFGSIVGWGRDSATGDSGSSLKLKQLNVPYIDHANCLAAVPASFYPFVTGDKFCAGFTNGTSLCSGDAGGGLVFRRPEDNRFYIRGLASVGVVKDGQCDSYQYGVYTKVSSYLTNIRQVKSANRQ